MNLFRIETMPVDMNNVNMSLYVSWRNMGK